MAWATVRRLSLCNVAHQAELNFLAIFLHRLIAQELGQFVLKFWKKIQVVSMWLCKLNGRGVWKICVFWRIPRFVTDRSFRYASPRLWNQLPDSFRQPHHSCMMYRFTSSSTSQLISVIIHKLVIHHSFTLSLQVQNLPFQQILPTVGFLLPTGLPHDNGTGPDLSCSSFYH